MILSSLRKAMARAGINIYILPRTDQYQSQFLTPSDQRISHISNFTGSNALALISQTKSLLWTDSRYYTQAMNELKHPWELMRMEKGTPKWFEYIVDNYGKQEVVGIDSKLVTYQYGSARLKYFNEKGFNLKFLNDNLVDEIWQNRPKDEHKQIYVHEKYAGVAAAEKVEWVRQKMKEKGANGCIITDLSEICWVLNLRSSEIPYSPFMKGILVIGGDKIQLYLPHQHPSLFEKSSELSSHLKQLKVQLVPYPIKFESLPESLLTKDANYFIHNQLKNLIAWEGIGLQRARRPIKEQQGFRNSHVRDGVAMTMFWSKRAKMPTVGEYQSAQMINNERLKQQLNKGLSFQTISAGGPNAAIVHYRPSKINDFQITPNMIHLVDSGGQYLDGTTDVTRAFHFGIPTKQQKDAFTRVLLGNLDIQRLKWPADFGIKGSHIDVLARRRLWEKGLNYGHGTGHGVGFFAGVHEGPVGISHLNNTVLEEGMITSNQPGYYKDGCFGIRIQNLLLVLKNKDNPGYLRFQCLTLCPYDVNLIDVELMSEEDVEYVNRYHARCWTTLSPLIKDEGCLEWLKNATRQIRKK